MGFFFHRSNCAGMEENCRCETCVAGRKTLVKNVQSVFQPKVVPFGPHAQIDHIANDPVRAKAEIVAAVGRDGAADKPLDSDRAKVAAASDVEVISTRYNMNEHTHAM